MTLPGGTRVVVRDPYGGLLARNRLFFSFSVRSLKGGSPSGVARVTWALDGRVVRSDPTPPFAWTGSSDSKRRMPAGDHQVTVMITPTGDGKPVATTFRLTATDCQPAASFVFIEEMLVTPRPIRGSQLYATSSFESGRGPTMRAVTFRSTDVSTGVSPRVRGRVAGTLRIGAGGRGRRQTMTLRVPRIGGTLLARGRLRVVLHPGAERFLTVTGLPAGTREATVRLAGAGGADLLAARRIGPNRCRYSVAAVISGVHHSVRVKGGTVTGVCRFSR